MFGLLELDGIFLTSISAISMGVGIMLTRNSTKAANTMSISNKGKNLIKEFEGLRLTAYQDSVGVWTIGYGHTGNVSKGQVITQAQADAFFDSDVQKFVNGVRSAVGNTQLTQGQFDALVSFSYNLGLGNLQKSTLLKKVKANPNDKSIRDEFLKWVKAGGVTLQGLVRRRTAEADLYFS